MKKLFFLALLFSSMLIVLSSCSPFRYHPDGTGTLTDTTKNEMPNTPLTEDKDLMILFRNQTTNYKIINGASFWTDGNLAVNGFAEEVRNKTGINVPVCSVTEAESGAEILIGQVSTRAASTQIYGAMGYTECRIDIVGEKICVSAHTIKDLNLALNALATALMQTQDGAWGIPNDFCFLQEASSTGAVPLFRTAGSNQGVYSCGEGNYEVSFSGVSVEERDAYLKTLLEEGYTVYAENDMAGNLFGTYVREDMQVHLSWYPGKHLFKVIWGASVYLPALERSEVEHLKIPSVTQLARNGAAQSAPGMSYVIQLSDGSYIIIDGGPKDDTDEQALLAFLIANKPEGHKKPQIAAWMITHAHGDHIDLALSFLENHHADVDVRMAAFNFPDLANLTITHESASVMNQKAVTFKQRIQKYYKNADILVFHTGQNFWIGDAEIEILYTHEDLFPAAVSWGNHTSSAFRIRLGGKSIMILGDCEKALCQFMADVYGDYLKSDMLQLSHHGYNGACSDLYEAIDPAICFWATDEYHFLKDPRCLGDTNNEIFNKWIRDDKIRVREHYHSSITTTITLNE